MATFSSVPSEFLRLHFYFGATAIEGNTVVKQYLAKVVTHVSLVPEVLWLSCSICNFVSEKSQSRSTCATFFGL